jgi:hypothetical protein
MDDWTSPFYRRYSRMESMEKYGHTLSEQALGWPDAHSHAVLPISSISDAGRALALVSVLRRAREFVGEGGEPDLPGQLDFILGSARRGNLPASLYETIWRLRGIFREHVISDDVATPIYSGENT